MPRVLGLPPDHQKVNGRLFSIFDKALQENCDKGEVFLPLDWKVSKNTVVQPDIVIVCGGIKKKFLDFTPSLVLEILSPSTAYKRPA